MSFQIGTRVVYLRTRKDDGSKQELKEGTITKLGKETAWLNNAHKQEEALYVIFLYPDLPECRALLQERLDLDEQIKKLQNDYMIRTYKLLNELRRRGLK